MTSIDRKVFWQVGIIIALVLSRAAITFAQSKPTPTTQVNVPETCFVGFYINDIYGLDLKSSTYVTDFYLWLRWRGSVDPSNIEFLNGTLDLKEHPNLSNTDDAQYLSLHCRGTFHSAFDYRRYPLDEHDLVMEMEDGNSGSDKLKYAVDHGNMLDLAVPTLSGWNCGQPRFEVKTHVYKTNFGDPKEPASSTAPYSRLYCTVHISRRGTSIYIKTFLALFISVAISFLSFVLKPNETDPRFGVGIAAIFGAASSEIVVTNNLPEMPYLTLADKLHLFSLFVIFLSLLLSCLSLRLHRNDKAFLAGRIDRVGVIAFPLIYAAVVLMLTVSH